LPSAYSSAVVVDERIFGALGRADVEIVRYEPRQLTPSGRRGGVPIARRGFGIDRPETGKFEDVHHAISVGVNFTQLAAAQHSATEMRRR
jgi:hypothetical protein